ncbi:unnamed protein product [Echinostoma caproni]|uniref:Phosphorylase b kinase regulatory subunit n=1 Tax=Echinostoma caproni TaxID=27848 RepID=A0A183A4Z4_9TREM|nr:unnamed protein product [Echinostoma caproni]
MFFFSETQLEIGIVSCGGVTPYSIIGRGHLISRERRKCFDAFSDEILQRYYEAGKPTEYQIICTSLCYRRIVPEYSKPWQTGKHYQDTGSSVWAALLLTLVRGGAHLDATDRSGLHALDPMFRHVVAESRCRVLEHITLACQAARVARRSGFTARNPFLRARLPEYLLSFIELH